MIGISPLAIVSPEALLGERVEIGPLTIVHGVVQIGTGSRIESRCNRGLPTAPAGALPS